MDKNTRLRRIVSAVVFLIVIAVVLTVTGKVVRAKFIGDSTTIVNGFYAEEKNDIDMIVIGSSNSFCTVNPLVLYENYGIAAYDFGSSSQPMNISTFYLKEALKRQKPKLVALEIKMLFSDSSSGRDEAALRWGFTDMPLSVNKLKCIYQSLGAIDGEYFSYVFPVFRYHNRWKELSKTDYTYFYKDKTNYTKGYLETQSVSEVDLSSYYNEGETWIDETNLYYLDEIVKCCKENGIELMFFKSPMEGWYSYYTEYVERLADERGIAFVDYNKLYHEGGIELNTTYDFRDAHHLNDFGANKVSMHLGEYVVQNYDLPDRRLDESENSWDRALLYKKRSSAQEFMAASNASECLKLLQNDENYILIVTDANSGEGGKVQQWVYEDRKVVFNKIWEKDGVEHRSLGSEGKLVLAKLGMLHQVLIDDVEQYQSGARWSIIVYDKITESVTANLYFDE